jgi:demethylmenaquinone methyltransferase/2-methoxy-6-polyprenyl-1,4-benzoquinol methylase
VSADSSADGDALIADQIAYYRVRAPEYNQTFSGSHDPELIAALDAFAPRGRVLELAAGTGAWTEAVLRHPIESLLAVDAAPEMLVYHERRIGDPRVTRLVADLFAWQPPDRYDVVTFAFWLSHVPPALFASFWGRVRVALAPGGRVFFVDQDRRGMGAEQPTGTPEWPTVERPVPGGGSMTAIKVYYRAAELGERLRAIGWDATVHEGGDQFLVGEARPRSTQPRS